MVEKKNILSFFFQLKKKIEGIMEHNLCQKKEEHNDKNTRKCVLAGHI